MKEAKVRVKTLFTQIACTRSVISTGIKSRPAVLLRTWVQSRILTDHGEKRRAAAAEKKASVSHNGVRRQHIVAN